MQMLVQWTLVGQYGQHLVHVTPLAVVASA